MSLINKEIVGFSVQAWHKGAFKTVLRSDALGKRNVFFFYPADFTFVCPTELEALQANCDKFQPAPLRGLLGFLRCPLYPQGLARRVGSHQEDRVPELAGPTRVLARGFGAYIEEDGMLERAAFIANPEGKIATYEVNAGNVGRNAGELLRKLQACQFVCAHGGEVCPATWQPGEATLRPSIGLAGKL